MYLVSEKCSVLKCGLYSAVWDFYVFHLLVLEKLPFCHGTFVRSEEKTVMGEGGRMPVVCID